MSSSTEILFVRHANPFIDASAAGNRYAGLLASLARHSNVSITILIFGGYLIPNELEELEKKKNLSHIKFVYLGQLHLYTLWGMRRWLYLAKPLMKRGLVSKLNKQLKRNPKAFCWVTIDEIALYFLLKAKSNRKLNNAFILELNEFNNISNEMGHTTNPIQRYFSERENTLLLAALMKMDGLLVMTQTLMKHFGTLVGPKTKLFHLPMTVNINRFTPDRFTQELKNEDPYVGFIGSFSNSKEGIDILINAFDKVREKHPNVKLKLAGGNHSDIPGQKELIQKLNLEDTVHYIGSLRREEVPQFLEKAKVLVMARPISKQAEGGFPTKLGEYLSTGNPVVVTRVGEIPNYLENGKSCFFAEPSNVGSLVNALCDALEDSEKTVHVGMGGRQVAENIFNADVQADRLLKELSNY